MDVSVPWTSVKMIDRWEFDEMKRMGLLCELE